MILSDRAIQAIREAYQAKVGNLALPIGTTEQDVTSNLVLAVSALLDTLAESERLRAEFDVALVNERRLREEMDNEKERCEEQIAKLQEMLAAAEARLQEDPCP